MGIGGPPNRAVDGLSDEIHQTTLLRHYGQSDTMTCAMPSGLRSSRISCIWTAFSEVFKVSMFFGTFLPQSFMFSWGLVLPEAEYVVLLWVRSAMNGFAVQ